MERVLECGREFYGAMRERGVERAFDREHLKRMIEDEDAEFSEAKDLTERVDALLDGVFYCADSLARPGVTEADEFWIRFVMRGRMRRVAEMGVSIAPLVEIVHAANMTKFSLPGGRLEGGKWVKPPGFVPPDEALRAEIRRQTSSDVYVATFGNRLSAH